MPTLDQYRNMLRINKLRLDDELEIQAEVQHNISAEVVRLNTRALEAENKLKSVEAELFVRFKEEGGKMTAEEIKASVRVNHARVSAWEQYQAAREVHELWSGLLAAWITKGYKLADVGSLYASDYFAMRTVIHPDGVRTRQLNAPDEESRSAIRRASERIDSGNGEVRRRASL
jgi:hypothetical protein